MRIASGRWPRAIMHVDGDAFFAACEQAVHPQLRGRPVVTGKERNIVAAASYEAKRLGITRGVALWEAKKQHPELVVLPSDYETYSLFSQRMFAIIRRFTPAVEEYSIDEAFADVTGLRRVQRASYSVIAQRIQQAIGSELGISVSVGVSLTKTLAKIASRRHKPGGLVVINGADRERALTELPVQEVWNIGPNTAALLGKWGLITAGQFARADEALVRRLLTKPGVAVWQELNGQPAWPVVTTEKTDYQSISKVKTFTPPSGQRSYVWAQLVKNVENACLKARRFRLAPRRILVFLRRHDFADAGVQTKLLGRFAYPPDLLPVVREMFDYLFRPGTLYRLTGVVLMDLNPSWPAQIGLFDPPARAQKLRRVYRAVDAARRRWGKHAIHQASSLLAQGGRLKVRNQKAEVASQNSKLWSSRHDVPSRKHQLLPGETARRRLPLPLWHMTV